MPIRRPTCEIYESVQRGLRSYYRQLGTTELSLLGQSGTQNTSQRLSQTVLWREYYRTHEHWGKYQSYMIKLTGDKILAKKRLYIQNT